MGKIKNHFSKFLVRKLFGAKYYHKIKIEKIIWDYRVGKDFNSIYAVISKLFDENSCFIDIGANMGKVSSRLSRRFPSGMIVAIEPVSFNFKALEKFKERANLDNVTILKKAISNSKGKTKIHIPVLESGVVVGTRSSLDKSTLEKTNYIEEEVDTDTLDSIIDESQFTRLDYIKSDTEGLDAIVLESGKESIKKYKPIIRSEEPWNSDNFDWLLKLGYKAYYLVNRKFVGVEVVEGESGDTFFIHEDKLNLLDRIS